MKQNKFFTFLFTHNGVGESGSENYHTQFKMVTRKNQLSAVYTFDMGGRDRNQSTIDYYYPDNCLICHKING